jgi:CDP-glucose 4,6-dehydratase
MVRVSDLKNYYNNKRVFITGHTGFKGSWLSTILLSMGATVKGYALELEYDNVIYNELQKNKNFTSIIADVRNAERLAEEIINFNPDYIFHLAAQPLVRESYKMPANTFEINVMGTANLLECIKVLPDKCSTVIITTDKVYENEEQHIHYKETDRLGGHDPYSASKACTEIVVSSFRNSFFSLDKYPLHQKAIATARAGNVIGGGDWSADRIIPDIVNSLLGEKPVEVRNPGAVRPWQHVLEPLFGYLLLGANLDADPSKFSEAFNFGPADTDHLTVKEVVEKCISVMNKGSWLDVSNNAQPHEANLLMLDIEKAKNTLGWKPKLNSSEAITWTMNWYNAKKESKVDLTNEQINTYQDI